MRYAVVIANLGGPASLDDVSRFLYALFSDRRMMHLPSPMRQVVAWVIATVRRRKSSAMYASIGGTSPIIAETKRQASSLELMLSGTNDTFKVFSYMRYSGPSAADILLDIKNFQPDKLVILPLYPQASTSTTLSVFDAWGRALCGAAIETIYINDFHDSALFARAHSRLIRTAYGFAIQKKRKVCVLFSAHGIPESFVNKGDVYPQQILQSVRMIVDLLKIDDLDWCLAYQSRVGPMKWLRPYMKDEIIRISAEGKFIIVVPISFVSDNLEILHELDILYKELAIRSGASGYFRVNTLGTDDLFIQAMADKVLKEI